MTTQIYVNLPVKDLPRSIEFFQSLGFEFHPGFSDENGTCMIVAENIFVMLLTEPFFQTFTRKSLVDAKQNTEVLVCLSLDDRARIDDIVAKAVAAGGKTPIPAKDHGFMYQHGFEDLDGHQWELVHMSSDAQDAGA